MRRKFSFLLAIPLLATLVGCDETSLPSEQKELDAEEAQGSPSDLCAQVAQQAGFPTSSMVTAVAIALAESACDPQRTNKNGSSGDCPNGSTDRGLWQINDCYHPEVNDACAFDAVCNAKAAFTISSGGTNWSQWAAFNNGSFKQHISEAQAAVDRLN